VGDAQRCWEDVAVGDVLDGFSLPLTMTRMALRVSGTQDFYINTGFIRAALCRLVTDWAGDAGFVRRLGFQMRRPHLLGDTIGVKGRVTRKWRDGADAAVELDVWIENPRAGVATPGSATVVLPSRAA